MTRPSLRDQAYQVIKQSILDGSYPEGALLTERTLAERFSMSRTPIRTAVDRLESEGYLQSSPNRGIRVREMSLRQVLDFFDFRLALEPYAVDRLAAIHLSAEDSFLMLQNLDAQDVCVQARDFIRFTALDSEFHLLLVRLYGNQEMVQTMEHLQDKLFRMALNVLKKDPARIHQSALDHRAVWTAVAAGDGSTAADLLRNHLEYGKRILVK